MTSRGLTDTAERPVTPHPNRQTPYRAGRTPAASLAGRRQPVLAAVRLRLLRQHHLQPDDRQAGLPATPAWKLGAFIGTYALTPLLPAIGFGKTSAIVAGVSLAGLLVTVTLLPEPKGISLEELTETRAGHMNLAPARRRAGAPR